MREGITPEVLAAISADVITTAYLVRLDFQTETCFLWTGVGAIQPSGSGDSLLDGNTFDPIADGVPYDLGENTFTMEGSSDFKLAIAIPVSPTASLANAQVYAAEYQSRPATIWRAIKLPPANALAAPVWVIRRIRSGAMDKVDIQNDGRSHIFTLTIESHQSVISNATNQSYLDQKRYDPADTSQEYAASIANGSPAPSKPVLVGGAGSVNIPSYKITSRDFAMGLANIANTD